MTVTKEKITVSIDAKVLASARGLFADRSTSSMLEEALRKLVRTVQNERDAEIYRRAPLTEEEMLLGTAQGTRAIDILGDDTDWEALYPDPEA